MEHIKLLETLNRRNPQVFSCQMNLLTWKLHDQVGLAVAGSGSIKISIYQSHTIGALYCTGLRVPWFTPRMQAGADLYRWICLIIQQHQSEIVELQAAKLRLGETNSMSHTPIPCKLFAWGPIWWMRRCCMAQSGDIFCRSPMKRNSHFILAMSFNHLLRLQKLDSL